VTGAKRRGEVGGGGGEGSGGGGSSGAGLPAAVKKVKVKKLEGEDLVRHSLMVRIGKHLHALLEGREPPVVEDLLDPKLLHEYTLPDLKNVVVQCWLRYQCASHASTVGEPELSPHEKTKIISLLRQVFDDEQYKHQPGDFVTGPASNTLKDHAVQEGMLSEHLHQISRSLLLSFMDGCCTKDGELEDILTEDDQKATIRMTYIDVADNGGQLVRDTMGQIDCHIIRSILRD
jgi:hypothetical protein